jgi:hypothetical protein
MSAGWWHPIPANWGTLADTLGVDRTAFYRTKVSMNDHLSLSTPQFVASRSITDSWSAERGTSNS